MENEFKKKSGLQTRDSVMDIIIDYVKNSTAQNPTPVTSCHSAVGYWILNEDRLEPTDELVLLGTKDKVFHSILMRGDDIIGDTERAQRGMDTSYDRETGEYKSKMFKTSTEDVTYHTVERMTIADFKARYIEPEAPDSSLDHDGLDNN